MERAVAGVKRRYDATGRRARAEEVRRSLVDTAREMLLSDGYAATTIPRVARACGVSVDSVYKRFPGRAALVRAVVEEALRGAGQVPAEVRSDALRAADLASLLSGWGRLTMEVSPQVAPVLLLVRAAAALDPDVVSLAQQLDDDRRSRMHDNAQRLQDAGHLAAHVSVDEMADVLWTYSAPELYDLLVLRRGWDIERYGRFVSTGIAAQIGAGSDPAPMAPDAGQQRS
jgi:AcrR family transcriptional regulator